MPKKNQFQKKSQSFSGLIQLTAGDGIHVPDHQSACHTLRNAGYERLICYFFHQIDPENTWVAEVTAVMDELDCGSKYFGVPENGRLNLL